MILTVTVNPSVDMTLFVNELHLHDTNRVARVEVDAGGKGVNLSRMAAKLGAKTAATGFLGGETGLTVQSSLEQVGADCEFVWLQEATRTNIQIEDGSQNPPTSLNAKGPQIGSTEWAELKNIVARRSKSANWVCMGGSIPPGLPPTAWVELAECCPHSQLLIDADGESMRAALETARLSLIKPNRDEAERLLDAKLDTEADISCAVAELQRRMKGPGAIAILSLGADGAALCDGTTVWRGTSAPIEAVSTIGSGDSLLGGFITAKLRGHSLDECLRWGLAAGAATATTNGSQLGSLSVTQLLYDRTEVMRIP